MFIFLLSCFFVNTSYEIVDRKLSTLSYYENSNRKTYIQKNIIKGFYLLILSIVSSIYFMFYQWDNYFLRMLASCYCSNDIVGLYKCSELPLSTRIHHVTSACFLIFTFTIDFTISHVGKLLVFYTYFSALAFPVNLYLGLRLCFEIHPPWLEKIRYYCKWWYLLLCFINWIVQMYLISSVNIETGIYTTMMVLIILDDIILLKWLFKNNI